MRNEKCLPQKLCAASFKHFTFTFLITHFSFLILYSCTSPLPPEQQAAQAARDCYQHLVDNQPIEFLEGKAGIDSLPNAYVEQLLQATRVYLDDIADRHGGLREVRISDNVGRRDTLPGIHTPGAKPTSPQTRTPLVYAFLLLCYGDSTQEEIVVPMVEQDGQWLMK